MFGENCFHRLQFDQNHIVDYNVSDKISNRLLSKTYRESLLAHGLQTRIIKCDQKCLLVNRLQKSASQLVDHFK